MTYALRHSNPLAGNPLKTREDVEKALLDLFNPLLPAFSEGGYTAWQIGTGWVTIGPHDEVKGKSAHPGRLIWNIETPDVKGEFERLKNAGATVIREPYGPDESPDGWIGTFADPDDNYFQLMSPMGPPGS